MNNWYERRKKKKKIQIWLENFINNIFQIIFFLVDNKIKVGFILTVFPLYKKK